MEQKEFDLLVAKVGEAAADKIATATKGFATEDQLKEAKGIIDTLNEKSAKIEEIARELGVKITEMETKSAMQFQQPQTIQMQIKSYLDANKDAIERVKAGEKVALPQMHIKAVTMTNAASLNSSAYLPNPVAVPGLIDLVRVKPTFWDRLSKGATRANPLYWVNKTNKLGNAEFIGEGVLKPLASFELETETSVPKKVAERMKASTELLYDVEGMESFIRDELRYEVMIAANTAVLTGVASATSPAGVTTVASAYNLATISTPNPNNYDAILAAATQIRSLNFNGVLEAYMNPIDIANMKLTKATDSGVYMIPPFTTNTGMVINGIEVIEDNNIAVGSLLIGDMTKYRILMHQDFFVAFGWEDDDFSKNLVTVIGEMRFHQYTSSNWTGAWVYDTFANIKAALEPAII